MNRTQIYLPKTQLDELRRIAGRQNTTVSHIVRDFIEEKLPKRKNSFKKEENLLDVAKRIHALGLKGPRDLATDLDEYLYGEKE